MVLDTCLERVADAEQMGSQDSGVTYSNQQDSFVGSATPARIILLGE